MPSSPVHDLSDAIAALHLTHRRQFDTLLAQQHRELEDLLSSSNPATSDPVSATLVPIPATVVSSSRSTSPSACVSDFARCTNGRPLLLGSPVRLLTSARSGRIGDTAVITRTPSSAPTAFVSIRLDSTGTVTTRRAENLEVIE